MAQESGRLASLSIRFQVAREAVHLIARVIAHRRVLMAVARLELRQRYAGSFLGSLWYPLHWGILLGMYCLVYVVIFKQRMPEFGQFG